MRSKDRRNDGLLFLVAMLSIFSFLIPFPLFENPNPSIAFFVCIGVSAFVGMLVVALFLAANLWLLLGNASRLSRFLTLAAANVPPLLLVLAGFVFVTCRIGYGVDLLTIFAIASQRLLAVLLLMVLGETLQRFSHWRINGPIGSAVQRRRMQTSISDLLVLTTMVGVVLVLFTFWAKAIASPQRLGVNSNEVSGRLFIVATATVIEMFGTGMLLLAPAFVSYGAPWIRRHYPSSVCLWTILLTSITIPIGFVFASVEHLRLADVVMAATIYFGCGVGIALVLWFMLWLLAKQGFSFCSNESATDTATLGSQLDRQPEPASAAAWSPWYRRWMFRICGVTALSIGFFCYFVDAYTLFDDSCSFADARRMAWLLREEGYPVRRGRPSGRQQVNLGRSPTFALAGDSKKQLRILRAIVPQKVTGLRLVVEGEATAELFDEVSTRTVNQFAFDADEVDENAFDRCCNTLVATGVDMRFHSVAMLESLKKIKGLKTVSLRYPVLWDASLQKATQGLPINGLTIRLKDDDLGDPRGLAGLKSLKIERSRITRETAMKLAQLKLSALTFDECELDVAAARELAKAKTEFLGWDEQEKTVTKDEAFIVLVSNTKTQLQLEIDRDEVFVTKLHNLALGSLDVNGNGLGDFSSEWHTFLSEIESEESGDDTAALQRIATKLQTDEAGNLIELDLRGMPLSEIDFSAERFRMLRRLSIGHPSQSLKTFRQIATLSNLQELEIANDRVSSKSFREICNLKKLKRLLLPSAVRTRAEVIPLPVDAEDVDVMHLASVRYGSRELELPPALADGYYYEEYGSYLDFSSQRHIDHDAFNKSADLNELECLLIPGHLLASETINCLEQFPNLKELHAPFSFVDQELLSRISKMERLETLSIGVPSVSKTTLDKLANLPNLKTLQLIVFDNNLMGNPNGQKPIKVRLKKSLPNCEVHLRVFESFPSLEDVLGY